MLSSTAPSLPQQRPTPATPAPGAAEAPRATQHAPQPYARQQHTAQKTSTEPSLFDLWCLLRTELEWLCHLRLGCAFAPWDYTTHVAYARASFALRRAVEEAQRDGAIVAARAEAMHSALAAHGDEPAGAPRSSADDRARALAQHDEALRAAFEPPLALRPRVYAVAPPRHWPLDAHAAPPWARAAEGLTVPRRAQ